MFSVKERAFLKDIGEAIRRIQLYTKDLEYEAEAGGVAEKPFMKA